MPYETDPDRVVTKIRTMLSEHDGVRIEIPSAAHASPIRRRLTPLETPRVLLVWPDFPQWEIDDYGDAAVRTHNALTRQ